MGNLVFVSGDFSSGTTLLFTLFRKTGEYYSLYEPLHEKLLEYLIWPLREYEHHFFVSNYFSEYKGFRQIPELFNPEWGNSGLVLPATAEAPELYRYLSYVIGTAFGRAERVMLKENRFTFRLGWLRATFPQAKVVHIYRDPVRQWNSVLRRVQAYYGRDDVGQDKVTFNGFNIARWCEDIKGVYPQLAAEHFRTGHERFCRLWELSFAEHQRYADISVDYDALVRDFEATATRIGSSVGYRFDTASLKRYVVAEGAPERTVARSAAVKLARSVIDRAGRKYARVRLSARALVGKDRRKRRGPVAGS
jgi:sulfotransferase family protein